MVPRARGRMRWWIPSTIFALAVANIFRLRTFRQSLCHDAKHGNHADGPGDFVAFDCLVAVPDAIVAGPRAWLLLAWWSFVQPA